MSKHVSATKQRNKVRHQIDAALIEVGENGCRRMIKRRKRKVAFQKDRDGTPINIGDWLMFDDGPFHVYTLTYYGKGLEPAIGGCWTAENEDGDVCDNLGAGKVISI